jgi:phage terminase large subunit-like protein
MYVLLTIINPEPQYFRGQDSNPHMEKKHMAKIPTKANTIPSNMPEDISTDPPEEEKHYILSNWEKTMRPSQGIPEGDWRTWLIMAGRGFGKTRTGAETIRHWVKTGQCRRIALIGNTDYDVQEVMVNGHTGLMNVHERDQNRPKYSITNRKVTWPCGAVALTYTAHAYECLRGPQFDGAWVDELAKFENARELWDQLMFGLRLGAAPKVIVTTTPRPIPLLRDLEVDSTTMVTRGSTYENAENLPPAYVQQILKRYEGTKLGAQEIMGHVLHDHPGFLWQSAHIRYGTDEDTNPWHKDKG